MAEKRSGNLFAPPSEKATRVVYLPTGRVGTVVKRGFDLWHVRWDGGSYASSVDMTKLRDLTDLDCDSCADPQPDDVCPQTQRRCRHHCNHSWTHDRCCWCAWRWGEGGKVTKPAVSGEDR